jgi:hypothetical protein
MTTVVIVTDEDNRASIGEAITHHNERAKVLSRRGRIGTLSAEYRLIHEQLNVLLADYETARD